MSKSLDPEIEKQISDMVSTMSTLLDKMISNHNHHIDNKAQLAILENSVDIAKKSISKVLSVLHEDNGEKALVTRVHLLEQSSDEAKKDIDNLYKKYHNMGTKDTLITKELIISLVSAISAIIAAYLAST